MKRLAAGALKNLFATTVSVRNDNRMRICAANGWEQQALGALYRELVVVLLSHESYAEELEYLQSSGLQAASIQAKVHSIFVDSMAPEPKDTADRIEAIERSIALTVPYVPAMTAFVIISGVAPEGNFRKAVETTVSALRRLGDFAARHNVRVAFEPLSPVNF